MFAHDRRDALDQGAYAEVLQRQVGEIGDELIDIGSEPFLVDRVLARPVEQHFQHGLVVAAGNPESRSMIWLRRVVDSRPVMPKSIIAIRLPGR